MLEAVKVTAVLVAHNGGAYLPTVLTALADQTRAATAILAADVGSTDDSGELLRKALGERNVISFDGRRGGYGAAVKAVLAHEKNQPRQRVRAGVSVGAAHDAGAPGSPAGSSAAPAPEGVEDTAHEWIWLLQDDAAPAPDALERLL
ncbi:MAG: glycosyltransferase, partial [Specibacter sp.]